MSLSLTRRWTCRDGGDGVTVGGRQCVVGRSRWWLWWSTSTCCVQVVELVVVSLLVVIVVSLLVIAVCRCWW